MKKLLLAPAAFMLIFTSCKKTDSPYASESELTAPELEEGAVLRSCASYEVLQEQLKADPTLKTKMQRIEELTNDYINNPGQFRLVNGVIEIPVVVNVLYRTASENISADQIASQIEVLNDDYNNTNADRTKVPAEFTDEQTSVGIRFVLENIVRKETSKRSWSLNDDMKRTSKGGIDPTSPTTTLNMWVVNKMTSQGSTILGYAQFPGGSSATDGVVIGYNFFGKRGLLSAPYHLGRTATHEVGHWLNLRHIWGDATCGNDQVADTPPANTANYGCPSYPHKSTCTGQPNEMTMNYMDYTDDACMYMFSNGQKARVMATFQQGGGRYSFAQ